MITNAIKFTSEGSIRFGYELRGQEIYFYVSDTGCGFGRPSCRIFGRFVKLNLQAGNRAGTFHLPDPGGVYEGNIGVVSEEGKGSTFWFTLPYKPAMAD
ncbi:MAG: ATP-binding protein [Bacteroides stercoris]